MSLRYSKYRRESLLNEEFVVRLWDGGYFSKEGLRAKDGRRLQIVFGGHRNEDSGADFRDAEIKVGDRTVRGDVEIHVRGSDWKLHHHHLDPRYNRAVLHVVMWDDGPSLLTKKQNGERIPTLILHNHLVSPVGKLWKRLEHTVEQPAPCRNRTGEMTPEELADILEQAGRKRFLKKAAELRRHIDQKGADQVLYEQIMRGLGYSKNRDQFLDLARRVPLQLLVGLTGLEIQAVLLGVAGLLPSPDGIPSPDSQTRKYVKELRRAWDKWSSGFRKRQMSEEQWELCGLRPVNFPARRMAGMSLILSGGEDQSREESWSILDTFLSVFSHSDSTDADKMSRSLQRVLMPAASGYWSRHYSFGGRSNRKSSVLVGKARAADIVVNVILPVVHAIAVGSGNRRMQRAVMSIYSRHAKLQDNKITRYVAGQILNTSEKCAYIVNSAMQQQGLIHVYSLFCSKRQCDLCPFMGKSSSEDTFGGEVKPPPFHVYGS